VKKSGKEKVMKRFISSLFINLIRTHLLHLHFLLFLRQRRIGNLSFKEGLRTSRNDSITVFSAFILVFIIIIGTNAQAAGVISSELQSVLQSLERHEEVPVIITLQDKADIKALKREFKDRHLMRAGLINALKSKADATQGPVRSFLETARAKKIKQFWIINGIAASVPARLIPEIAQFPGIESVILDTVIHAPEVMPAEVTLPEWNIDRVRAPDLWSFGIKGQGVVVANMDTGVDYLHPDLYYRWRGGGNSWHNFFSSPANSFLCRIPGNCSACELSSLTPCDLNGHGTGTMGVIAGGDAGGTAIGAAPDTKWIAVKMLNDKGVGSTSSAIDGFQWLFDLGESAPDVINNSWGFAPGQCFSGLQSIIHTLREAGIAVVFSAGNSGPYPSTSVSPANYPESFSVGATDMNDLIAGFSSRGPSACDETVYPEVVAPGVNIRTTDLTFGGVFPDSYVNVSGTSFSAPHVAGAVALLRTAFPGATVSEIEASLSSSSTATDLGKVGPDYTYGYGLINVREAFFNLLPTHFDAEIHPNLFVVREGTGTGTVTANGTTGIDCGVDCAEKYSEPVTVSLLATPGYGNSFSGWSEDCSGTGDCSFVASPDSFKIVRANFATNTFVKVLTPIAQEVIASGTDYEITWETPPSVVTFKVKYSPDNGFTWYTLGTTNQYETTFSWKVPTPLKNRKNNLLKVVGYTKTGVKVGSAVSAPFSIEVVKLTNPNSAPIPTIFTSGDPLNITWTTNETRRLVTKVILEYTKNGGQTWIVIDRLTGDRLTEFNGFYPWTIPVVLKTKEQCKVRVRLKDSTGAEIGRDASDNYFTINPR
jgi:bacillopeptidase F